MLRTGQAAELLGVDKRTLLRYVEQGRIRAKRIGRQHFFRSEDGEQFAGDGDAARNTRPVVSSIQNKREEVECLSLEVQARKVSRELARIEAEDEIDAREREDARRARAFAEKQAADEMRNRRRREKQELETRQREIAEREHHTRWASQFITAALASLPSDLPVDGCPHHGRRLNFRAGKLVITRGRKTSLPAEAQRCPHCSGPTIRRTKTGCRPGEIAVICTKCGKCAPFNFRRKRFVPPRASGRQPLNDLHRPQCRICHKPMHRHGVSRRSYQRNPLQLPVPARNNLGTVFPGRPDEIIAVDYWCREHPRCQVWKRPDGTVLWKRRPGRKLSRGNWIAKPQAHERKDNDSAA